MTTAVSGVAVGSARGASVDAGVIVGGTGAGASVTAVACGVAVGGKEVFVGAAVGTVWETAVASTAGGSSAAGAQAASSPKNINQNKFFSLLIAVFAPRGWQWCQT